MKRSLLFLPLLALAAKHALAEPPKAPVTKIVSRYIGPDAPPGSFGAKPKTLYLSGDTYLRVEEAEDPAQHVHGLIVCGEPDIWIINLDVPEGRHVVDPGPTFVTHANIVGKDAPGELADLEFGKEQDFLRRHPTTRLEPQVIDGQRCDVSELKAGNQRVVFSFRADTHKPLRIDVFKDGKPDFSIAYDSYETGIPFDATLFKPPAGVPITEEKPANSSR